MRVAIISIYTDYLKSSKKVCIFSLPGPAQSFRSQEPLIRLHFSQPPWPLPRDTWGPRDVVTWDAMVTRDVVTCGVMVTREDDADVVEPKTRELTP